MKISRRNIATVFFLTIKNQIDMTSVLATDAIASRFTEQSNGFAGDKTISGTPTSPLSIRRKKCEKNITDLAKQNGTTVAAVVSNILKNSDDQIADYIRSRMEVPAGTPNARVVQAAILRMNDIAVIANAANISDEDALAHIEAAESEAMELNTAESNNVLPPSTQAALKAVYETAFAKLNQFSNVKTYAEAMNYIRGQVPLAANNFAGFPANGNMKPNNFDISSLLPGGQMDTTAPSVTITGTQNNDDDDSSSIWDILGGIVSGAASVAGSAKQVAGSVSQIGTSLNGIGSNIGAASITKYVKTNWLPIVASIIAIVIIIILLVRAGKHK